MNEKSDDLAQENAILRARVTQLERQVGFLQTHSLLTRGMQGESLISQATDGRLTVYAAMHDVETASGHRLEVKRSAVTDTDKHSISKKWQWAKLFGEGGEKDFDFMILVGDVDERYRAQYKDPDSPYILFCIAKSDVVALSSVGQRPEYRSIQLGSNPSTSRSGASRLLFERYQVTMDELSAKFGDMKSVTP